MSCDTADEGLAADGEDRKGAYMLPNPASNQWTGLYLPGDHTHRHDNEGVHYHECLLLGSYWPAEERVGAEDQDFANR